MCILVVTTARNNINSRAETEINHNFPAPTGFFSNRRYLVVRGAAQKSLQQTQHAQGGGAALQRLLLGLQRRQVHREDVHVQFAVQRTRGQINVSERPRRDFVTNATRT